MMLTFLIKIRKFSINNVYHQLNVKYGYYKVTMIKIVLVLMFCYFLIDPGPLKGEI